MSVKAILIMAQDVSSHFRKPNEPLVDGMVLGERQEGESSDSHNSHSILSIELFLISSETTCESITVM